MRTVLPGAVLLAACAHAPAPVDVQEHAIALRVELNELARQAEQLAPFVAIVTEALRRAGKPTAHIESAWEAVRFASNHAQRLIDGYYALGEGYEAVTYAMDRVRVALDALRSVIGEVQRGHEGDTTGDAGASAGIGAGSGGRPPEPPAATEGAPLAEAGLPAPAPEAAGEEE